MVSQQWPLEENCPSIRDGVWVKFRVSFRVTVQPDNWFREKLPPQLELGFDLGLVLGLGANFSQATIVLEPK